MIVILAGLLLVLIVGATAGRLAWSFRSPAVFIIAAFFFAWADIALIGFVLSWLHVLDSMAGWIIGAAIGLVLAQLWSRSLSRVTAPNWQRSAGIALAEWRALALWQKFVLGLLVAATAIVAAVNFAMAVALAPASWDTLTYHLPRVAYFLQFGSLDYFPANYIYQNTHPKDGSLLLIFAFLGSGRHENAMQLVQFVAWWIGGVIVYGLARNAGNRRFESTVCGILFMLLTECVMEAATCQNDLLVAVAGGGAAFFVLQFRRSKWIALAGLPIGLGLGTKLSFLPLLASLSLVSLFAVAGARPKWMERAVVLLLATIASIALFSLPAGYAANFLRFGNPLGPAEMIALDSNVNRSLPQLAEIGELNLVRFGFHFFSLDGVPRTKRFLRLQQWMRAGPIALAERTIGAQLQRSEIPNVPGFKLRRFQLAHEDASYWGPLGFLLIWPTVLLVVCRWTGTRKEAVLAGAAIVFALVLAFVHPYDPWMGRFFLSAAPFACAAIGPVVRAGGRTRYAQYWIILVVAIGSFTAVSAALFRLGRPVFPTRDGSSVFALDRVTEMTIYRKAYREAIRAFDVLTPRDATVALMLPPDSYEFPLFGQGLTRRLIPAASQWRERRTLPEAAQYVLFSNQILAPEQGDMALGADWYLRSLHKTTTRNQRSSGSMRLPTDASPAPR